MEKKPDIFEWQRQRRVKALKGLGSFALKKTMLYHGHKLGDIAAYLARDGQILMGATCVNCLREIEAKMMFDEWRPNVTDFFIFIESPYFRQSFTVEEVSKKEVRRDKLTDSLVCAKFKTLV